MKKKIKSFLNLFRIRQYYKNGLIFIGAFFSRNILNVSLYPLLILGFIILCFTSSINYIINDIVDIENDKNHPEKLKKKPLASGDISIVTAIITLIVLSIFIASTFIIFIKNLNFLFMVLLIILTGQSYNHFFKKHAFIDILVLSLGYLWRALAGCLLIDVFISAWLFLATIEIALFLVIAKRKGDLLLLGENNAVEHKKSYDQYSLKLLEQFHVLIAGSIFMTYSLYLILSFKLFSAEEVNIQQYFVVLTIPLLLYIIMRYMYLTSSKPKIARNPELIFFDKGVLIAGISIFLILAYSFYFDVILNFLSTLLKLQ
ncbi:MAG: UbiA prenyltransferase family protein [Promethearchaeota archaeon]